MTKTCARAFWISFFGYLDLFGIWDLGFGILCIKGYPASALTHGQAGLSRKRRTFITFGARAGSRQHNVYAPHWGQGRDSIACRS